MAKKRLTILQAFKKMKKEDGLKSFYKGLPMALIGTIASFGSYFFCYRLLKNIVLHRFKMTESQLLTKHIMPITALAGATSASFSNPFWLVNTRMTIAEKKKSMKETVLEIYR